MLDEVFEKYGSTEIVGAYVTLNLVHRLAHADLGCQVKNSIDVFDGALDYVRIAYIPVDELGARVKVLWLAAAVYLRDQRIQHPHRVAAGYQSIGKVRTDEAGAAGD